MFFNKKKMKEADLGAWEKKSYMQIIPNNDNEDFISGIFDRVSAIDGIDIIDKKPISVQSSGSIIFNYDGEEYEVGFYPINFSVPEYYLEHSTLFTDEEKKEIMNKQVALTLFMDFKENSRKSYHLQLKLAVAMVPDFIGIMDESAERMLHRKWVKMTALSKIEPSSRDLYTIQLISGENGEVWLHTHGLCRCGITELEILQSNQENYQNHYNIINTYAMYLIDKDKDFDPRSSGAYIGVLANGQQVVVTCRSWTEGLKMYKGLKLGGLTDRNNGHNSKTSIIFIYKNENDENKGVLSKVSIYDEVWGDNPIFFITNEETDRMKALAMERFDYVKKLFADEKNQVLIKIGLLVDSKDDFEHIWFELIEFKKNKFKCKLTQEPYNVKDMHTGDEVWFKVENVTDWIIYTPSLTITPENVYLLDK